MRDFLDEQVVKESCGSTSEYVRILIRRAQSRAAERRLEELLLAALQEPAAPMMPEDWSLIRSELAARRAKRASEK